MVKMITFRKSKKSICALILLINNTAESAENFRSPNCPLISAHIRRVMEN